tara:strand:- start:28737 stop:30290 length:1554 start_codon:yes stop_codon:yes gene_type:complete
MPQDSIDSSVDQECKDQEEIRAQIEGVGKSGECDDSQSGDDGELPAANTFERLLEDCYKDIDGTPYLFLRGNDGSEVVPLGDQYSIDVISYQYYIDKGSFPKKKDAKEIVNGLRLHATFESAVAPVAYRVQTFGSNGMELKINKKQSVKVTEETIDIGPHIGHFYNPGHELDLPLPDLNGSIDPYLEVLGIDDPDDKVMIVGSLLIYLCPSGPYPIIVFKGPHGCGKTTTCTGFKSIIDPSLIEKMTDVHSPRDLYVVAGQNRVLSFDNVSEIPDKLFDAHCTIATGAQRAERKLYTNKEMSYVRTENPQIFNGIPNLFHREDFRERSVLIELPKRPYRRSLAEYKQSLEASKPRALGYLLNAMQEGLNNLQSTATPQGLRMADAARFITAAEPALGWKPGTFVNAYRRNQLKAIQESMSEEPVYRVLRKILNDNNGRLVGTPTIVFNKLNLEADRIDLSIRQEKSWPKGVNALSAKLNRMEGTLHSLGISFRSEHVAASERRITIVDDVHTNQTGV